MDAALGVHEFQGQKVGKVNGGASDLDSHFAIFFNEQKNLHDMFVFIVNGV